MKKLSMALLAMILAATAVVSLSTAAENGDEKKNEKQNQQQAVRSQRPAEDQPAPRVRRPGSGGYGGRMDPNTMQRMMQRMGANPIIVGEQKFITELTRIKGIAVEEKAEKTVKALENLIEKHQKELDSHEQRLQQMRERMTRRPRRPADARDRDSDRSSAERARQRRDSLSRQNDRDEQ